MEKKLGKPSSLQITRLHKFGIDGVGLSARLVSQLVVASTQCFHEREL